jgi:succinyl-CoA synthetase beta subunit
LEDDVKLHEYQSREILARSGIPFPPGKVASSPEEVEKIAAEAGGTVVVKAQVHVGGRGKAGGVKLAKTPGEAKRVAGEILGMRIKGLPVRRVLVAKAADIASEAYIGVVVDRVRQRPVLMASAAGGIDIEEVARKTPEKIHTFAPDPALGLRSYQARRLAHAIEDDSGRAAKMGAILQRLYRTFLSTDASLAEINPLVVTKEGEVVALDAKIDLDDNGLYRHPDLAELRDTDAESKAEVDAREAGLSYVKLEGAVGCIVNGAGLAMATMDLVKHYGGEPANFLDIGGSSSPEKMARAMKIVLSDRNVKAVLVNIFGGITRCDDVAQGIIDARKGRKVTVPVVARLTGTNQDKARAMLEREELHFENSMEGAVKRAVRLAMEGRHGTADAAGEVGA